MSRVFSNYWWNFCYKILSCFGFFGLFKIWRGNKGGIVCIYNLFFLIRDEFFVFIKSLFSYVKGVESCVRSN